MYCRELEELVKAAPILLGNRWDRQQQYILVGVITTLIAANGRPFNRKLDAEFSHIENLYNSLVCYYLPTRSQIRRKGRGLLAKFKKLKKENKLHDNNLLELYWSEFLHIVDRNIFLKPIFKITTTVPTEERIMEVLSSSKWDLDISLTQEKLPRCNMWTIQENSWLMTSVVKRFLLTGSLFPPRRSRGVIRGQAWSDISLLYQDSRKLTNPERPMRSAPTLARRMKYLKRVELDNLIKYFALGYSSIEMK